MKDLRRTIEELERIGVHTQDGTFVRVEDVRRLIGEEQEAKLEEAIQPSRMTVVQAREAAKAYLASQGAQIGSIREPGRSIPASLSQPSSRT